MKGKTVVITGATAGIGLETAVNLASQGAEIIFNTRDKDRGESARKTIIDRSGNDRVQVLEGDLASFASIRQFGQGVLEKCPKIDVLINNAGVWKTNRQTSHDGIEETLAVNHLAPFLLTGLLYERLKESASSRIVTVSSNLHYRGEIDFEDLELTQGFDGLKAYANSKMMNVLFANELARKLEGTGVTSNSLHPGFISTSLGREANFFAKIFIKLVAKPKRKGSDTSVYLASSPEVEGVTGKYFDDQEEKTPHRKTKDETLAAKLWAYSEEKTGIEY